MSEKVGDLLDDVRESVPVSISALIL